jgi:acyl dehydratase
MTPAGARSAFEDLEVGMMVPRLVRGPMSAAHLMRWSAATENWHRIHYDAPYATEVEKLPGLLVSGNLKQQLMTDLMVSWLEPDGWLASIAFEFRKMNFAGETLTAWARITRLSVCQERYGLVHCDIGITGDEGVESTPGHSIGVVPLSGGPPVPYPFQLAWDQ